MSAPPRAELLASRSYSIAEIAEARRAVATTCRNFDRTLGNILALRLTCEPAAAPAPVPLAEPNGPERTCPECGARFRQARPHEVFCETACRKSFNNRRAVRGAPLYDLFMALRYERGFARARKVWRAMCRLAETWRAEDAERRAGRKSWGDAGEILAQRPYLIVERGPRTRGGRR